MQYYTLEAIVGLAISELEKNYPCQSIPIILGYGLEIHVADK